MKFKVGNVIRIKTLEEMDEKMRSDFFGRGFFEKWGNHIFTVTEIADGYLGKKLKINVNDEWGVYFISTCGVEKINNKIELPNELFEL